MPCPILTGVLPVLFAAVSAAHDPSVVTEANFLSILDDAHPAMAKSSVLVSRARAGVVAAAELENPVLGFVREDLRGPAEQTEWSLTWQLPEASRRSTLEARRHEVDGALARLQLEQLDLRLQMKEVYAQWAFAVARLGHLSAQAERVAALADREAERARAGEASGLQARRLRLAADRLWTEVEMSAAMAEQARSDVLAWYPDLPGDARPVVPELARPPAAGPEHPLVQSAAKTLEAARLERRAAGRFIGSPELTVGWLREQDSLSTEDGPTVGLTWSVPLFARNRAEIAGSEARITESQARLEIARREVASARVGHAAAYTRLSAAVRRGQEGLTDLEPMLDAGEAAFRHGETSLTDLLEIYRSVTESELALLELHRQALAALRELERATGSESSPRKSEKESP